MRRGLRGTLVVSLVLALAGCGGAAEDSSARLARGRQALGRGDAAAAFADLVAVVRARPEAANDLAIAAKAVNRSGEALAAVEEALRLRPGDPELLFVAASLEIDVDRLGEAERNIGRALALAPQHLPSLLLKARLLIQTTRTREALAFLLETEDVVCGPGRRPGADPRARHHAALLLKHLGHVLLLRGEVEASLRRFDEAARLDPSYAEAHYGAGLARFAGGDLEGAALAFAEARRLDPRHLEAAYQAMNVAERLGWEAAAAEARGRFADLYRERLGAAGALGP